MLRSSSGIRWICQPADGIRKKNALHKAADIFTYPSYHTYIWPSAHTCISLERSEDRIECGESYQPQLEDSLLSVPEVGWGGGGKPRPRPRPRSPLSHPALLWDVKVNIRHLIGIDCWLSSESTHIISCSGNTSYFILLFNYWIFTQLTGVSSMHSVCLH